MQHKKGQAAMEFLMTYGWAILAAIVVIAVLAIYFRPSTLVSGNTIVSAPFFANAQQVNTSNVLLEIKNNGGETYNITEFDVIFKSPNTAACSSNITGVSIAAGEVKTLRSLNCSGLTSGGTVSADISISYTKSGSSLSLKSTGSLSDKVA